MYFRCGVPQYFQNCFLKIHDIRYRKEKKNISRIDFSAGPNYFKKTGYNNFCKFTRFFQTNFFSAQFNKMESRTLLVYVASNKSFSSVVGFHNERNKWKIYKPTDDGPWNDLL